MKSVDFPASFGDVTGVVACEDIPSNTVCSNLEIIRQLFAYHNH